MDFQLTDDAYVMRAMFVVTGGPHSGTPVHLTVKADPQDAEFRAMAKVVLEVGTGGGTFSGKELSARLQQQDFDVELGHDGRRFTIKRFLRVTSEHADKIGA